MSTAPSSEWLALHPHDTVHVRDGRTFVGGAGGHAESTRPSPSTVAGAIGAACRIALGKPRLPESVRGPVLARWEPKTDTWLGHFPTPQDLVTDRGGRRSRLRIQSSQAVTDLDHGRSHALSPLLPSQGQQRTTPLGGWLHQHRMRQYLHGMGLGEGADLDIDPKQDIADPLLQENRLGIALDDNKMVQSGMLYSATHFRLADRWSFVAECTELPCPVDSLPPSVPFGGVGRIADITAVSGVAWPQPPAEFPGGRMLLYLATPAVWEGGWRPTLDEGIRTVAAATGPPEPYSTAVPGSSEPFQSTSARFRMVPAGSVYYLQFPSALAAADWSRRHHARALGPAPRLGAGRPRLETAGFGVVLTGVWN